MSVSLSKSFIQGLFKRLANGKIDITMNSKIIINFKSVDMNYVTLVICNGRMCIVI
jgi:hypothetical protein